VFYIPQLLGEQLVHGTPAQAMLGFAVFYAVCLLLNGWFYLRRESVIYNP
jgi:NNP family nitrate/nitrite transporter-like MFS transporter